MYIETSNAIHYDVIKWKKNSAILAICAGNSPVPVNSPHKGQWRGALMFSLICARNVWINNGGAGDLRRHRVYYDVSVMICCAWCKCDCLYTTVIFSVHNFRLLAAGISQVPLSRKYYIYLSDYATSILQTIPWIQQTQHNFCVFVVIVIFFVLIRDIWFIYALYPGIFPGVDVWQLQR